MKTNMKKIISLSLALVMILTCLAGISFAADPIAEVTNGSETIKVETLEDLLAAIKEDGKTQIKLLADVVGTAQIKVPYSCTVDLNGHSWSTPTAGNAFAVQAVGSENTTTYIKNGVIDGKVLGVRVNDGALNMDNVIVISHGSAAVGYYTLDPKYNDANVIRNCTLVGTIYGAFSFLHQTEKQTGCKMFIENTKLIETKDAGQFVFVAKNGDGTVVLGKGVEMYSYKPDGYAQKTNLEGETVKAEFALASVEVPEVNVKAAGLSYWHTPEYVAPVVPETPAAPTTPTTPSVPTTGTPDVTTPATGVSVVALGVLAAISLAGAALTKKH